ncbi:MAG: sigma-70 family RNA polymerase sigma factor [Deltaproteobacteria bacterium]|nr:sigma-70 family RNA polymerase sigma factor [Deltaproteobacteria bacterium]MCB9786534.1 sigma-70 family RNA polymerase sigma factor [Deltaproteobacteria bacterium]
MMECRPPLHRLAVKLTRGGRALMSEEEARAVADAAMVTAWQRWDATRGVPFAIYARHWVRGAVARALRAARRQAPLDPFLVSELVVTRQSAERVALARLLLSRVPPEDRAFLAEHHLDELSFTELGESYGRNSAWAYRRHRRIVATISPPDQQPA